MTTITKIKQIADMCELQFQDGGPRVCVFDPAKPWEVQASPHSAKRAKELADAGQSVWMRSKVGNHYEWVRK